MKKITIPFRISDGELHYVDPFLYQKKKLEFIKKNEGALGELIYEIHKGAAYYQYKYFFGFVAKFIAMAQGEPDVNYVKEVLKEDYLFIKVNNKNEIPARHLVKCRIIEERRRNESGNSCKDEKGRPVYDTIGYIPSLSVLSFDEFEQFIKFCVFIRDGLTDWHMTESEMKEGEELVERIRSFEVNNK